MEFEKWEPIGSCGIGRLHEKRVMAELEIGIAFLQQISYETDSNCAEIGIMWAGCEVGDTEVQYPEIGLKWNAGRMSQPPINYVCACQDALSAFNHAVDWSALDIDELQKQFVITSWNDGGEGFAEEVGLSPDEAKSRLELRMSY